ncbi:hypothetical protein St703_04500 [Sporolactobacillus terrae]|uniref:Uncharacterized protein n=2 Tax=Sporolactobacillus terrae TaxID=269673 RepID=A0A5K7WTC4_9BACL|nr:hypothetical protein St703_04500 [Sporolactobacillus terrae]
MRAKEDPADQLRVRGGFRIARGKRAAGVSFVHKVMNKARMEGESKNRALFARFFLQTHAEKKQWAKLGR